MFIFENKELEKKLNANRGPEKPFSVVVSDLTTIADEFIVIRMSFHNTTIETRPKNRNRRGRKEQRNNAAANEDDDEDKDESEPTASICSKLWDSGFECTDK